VEFFNIVLQLKLTPAGKARSSRVYARVINARSCRVTFSSERIGPPNSRIRWALHPKLSSFGAFCVRSGLP
jgi:hypothetical protein